MERIKLNLDSIAMMLFCARLKAYKEVPLSNEEWLLIERIIKKKGLKGPASLLSMNQTELEEILEIWREMELMLLQNMKIISLNC